MKVLAALLQFGLLEKTGKGDVKVTQRAVEILHGLDPSDRNEALLEAALEPQLFKDIHERFPDGIPSEGVIRSYLIQQDFMDVAISPAINAFMETYRAVEHVRESESHGPEPVTSPEPVLTKTEHHMQPQSQTASGQAAVAGGFSGGVTLGLNKINMNIRGDQVELSGLFDLRGLRALERKIQGLKALLQSDEEDEDYGRPDDEDRDPRD